MQNLCLINTRTVSIGDLTGANVVQRFTIDSDKQILYLLTSHSIYSLTLENNKSKSIYSSTDPTITIEDLCFLSELNHLCLGLSNGDLISLQFDDHNFEENLNTIGTLEECIHELKLSPDQQILIAVTNTKVLLLSTNNDYEPIAETLLDTNEFGEQAFVNVGWGSKTTQFHGSLGKKAAIESVNTTTIKLRSDNDDGRSHIVWRDDGDLFAISFISLINQWRTIKIFNKQGQLQATNESLLNGCIESAIAWKISGELIGAAMRFNNGQKLTISFLEKNGLKHGELILETKENSKQYVEYLTWNKDSTILAIVIRQENDSYLQLWSSSNYHWYLKQSFPFSSVNIQSLIWDIDITNKLHLITNTGQYYSMIWSWTSQVSYTNSRSLVFLIDGCHLFVSDFTHSSIPPPMSSYEIISPLPILAITYDDDHNQLILILSDRSIAICNSSPISTDYKTIIHLSEIKSAHYITSLISSSESPIKNIHNSTHFQLINYQLYFIEDSYLHIYNFENKIKTSLLLNFNCLTIAINNNNENKYLYLQDENGKIFQLIHNELHAKMHFPRPCYHFSVILNDKFLGLTENYRLYLNTNELAHNCNSYFIHDKTILVYSTLQHQLFFRSLINDQSVSEVSNRRTERGTRIVCTAYTDLKLVLQMPRGNLETIYPRPLLLTYICSELIDNKIPNYKRAFELMRKNRLNLNFLYDYKPKEFFDHIPIFISNARNDDDICLFLSEIDNEKNTRNEYMKYILKFDENSSIDTQLWYPKANLICEKFRSYLQSTNNSIEHVNSILTTYIKQSPPNMEGALKYLNEHPIYFDNAIRYLTYFIDIDRLYDIALGTYNFELVLMISEKTQKDPKEYLPELNQLRLINNLNWRKFKIDCRLKRFKKAIENACDYFIEQLLNKQNNSDNEKFQEFINILENNRLYKIAIKKFLSHEQIQSTMMYINDIIKLYGDYLMTKKYYIEAALVYERGKLYEQANQAFRQGKDVQNSLKLLPDISKQIKQPITNSEQYRSLAEQFRHDSLYIESGQIYENYLNDNEEALLSYLQGHEWSHIIRLFFTSLHNRNDLYEHEFLSTFNNYYDDIQRQIHNDYEKFQSYIKRLLILRTNLFQHIKEILDSGRDYDIDENDDQSDNDDQQLGDDRQTLITRTKIHDDSGSIRTRLTKKSSSSKKSQRRALQQQEKLVQLKEGSKHEDLALIRELWLLITKFDKLNFDIRHINKICYQISTYKNSLEYEQKGELLQTKYNEYINFIEKQLINIWLNNPDQQQQQQTQENVQILIINKKIREKLKKDLDLISNQFRISPILISKNLQWKLVIFDSDVSV